LHDDLPDLRVSGPIIRRRRRSASEFAGRRAETPVGSQARRQKNITVPSLDLLIATVALHHGAEVVTFDDDFQKIAGVSKLRVKLLKRPTG